MMIRKLAFYLSLIMVLGSLVSSSVLGILLFSFVASMLYIILYSKKESQKKTAKTLLFLISAIYLLLNIEALKIFDMLYWGIILAATLIRKKSFGKK